MKIIKYITTIICIVVVLGWKERNIYVGKWKVNTSDSDKEVGYFFINVSQNANYLTIERILKDQKGKDSATTENLLFDSKISLVKLADSTAGIVRRYTNFKSINKDGSMTLTLRFITENKDRSLSDLKGSELWSIGGNGKVLTITRTLFYSDRTKNVKWIFDKMD